MQLVDELSMIYTTCLMCYATFSHKRSQRFCVILGLSLIGLAVFITLYYHYLQDPNFHQNAYALLTSVVIFRSMFLMEFNLRPSRRQAARVRLDFRDGDTSKASLQAYMDRVLVDRRDTDILDTMWIMVVCGLAIFLGGFAIWSLDNRYCPKLRHWRRQVGLPWGILLEGHGWW